MKKYLSVFLIAVLIFLMIPVYSAQASPGGLLNGKTLTKTTGGTTTALTDNNTATYDSIPGSSYFEWRYTFDRAYDIKSYSSKNDGNLWFALCQDAACSKRVVVAPASTTNQIVPVTADNVVGVIITRNAYGVDLKVYEFDVYETAPPDTTPPAVPTGLTGTAGLTNINLSWTAVSDIDLASYKVYRNGVYLATVTKPTTTYNVTGLTSSTSYQFQVSAVDTNGNESAKSNILTISTLAPPDTTPPAVPIGLAATAGNGQVVLNWTANTESDLKSYNIYRNGVLLTTVNKPATTYTVTGLTNGTTYTFQVSTVDTANNESAKSNTVTATPQVPAPGAPSGVTAVAGDAQVAVSWTAVSGSTGYTVQRATVSGGPYSSIATVTAAAYTDTTVSNGTTYYYVISANNVGGTSANSAEVNATPVAPLPDPPEAPVNAAGQAGDGQVTITWNSAANATGYNIKRAAMAGGPYTTVASNVYGLSFVDSSVTNGTVYYYVVSALNAGGESGVSNEVVAAPQAPAQPTLDISILEEKTFVGQEIYADVSLKGVNGIYAEDFTVNYDSALFDYVGFEEIQGYKVYNQPTDQNGALRFIVASQGAEYGITGEKTFLKLKLRAKAVGVGKVDALKCRIADTVKEFDLEAIHCTEDTVIVDERDVNKSGEYTLLDLAIDGYYYGVAGSTVPSQYNANQAGDDLVRDEDLVFIVNQMLNNPNYAPNNG